MDKLETKSAANIMLAYADGEKIEFSDFSEEWIEIDEPTWDFSEFSYRIKAKPLECWVVLTIKGEQFGLARNEADALEDAKAIHGRIVRMVQADD